MPVLSGRVSPSRIENRLPSRPDGPDQQFQRVDHCCFEPPQFSGWFAHRTGTELRCDVTVDDARYFKDDRIATFENMPTPGRMPEGGARAADDEKRKLRKLTAIRYERLPDLARNVVLVRAVCRHGDGRLHGGPGEARRLPDLHQLLGGLHQPQGLDELRRHKTLLKAPAQDVETPRAHEEVVGFDSDHRPRRRTVTARFAANPAQVRTSARVADTVDARDWPGGTTKAQVSEETTGLGAYGKVLTALVSSDIGQEEYPDEDEELDEDVIETLDTAFQSIDEPAAQKRHTEIRLSEHYTGDRLNSATSLGHAAPMSYWVVRIIRNVLVFLVAVSIAGGLGVSSSSAHPTETDGRFDCQTAASRSVNWQLNDTTSGTSVSPSVELGIKFSKPETDSKKITDSACCSAICSTTALLVEVFLPTLRDDPAGNWHVAFGELIPAGYDPLRRPPRTANKID